LSALGLFRLRRIGAFFRVPHHGSAAKDLNLEFRFESAVKYWLEQLGASPSFYMKEFPKETRDALVDYVVPALAQGIVRSSGPRESLTLQ